MVVKKCFKCLVEKPLSEFYKHSKMADGRLNKCKDCTRQDVTDNRKNNSEYYKAYDRARADLPERVAKRKEIAENWKTDPKLKKRRTEFSKNWKENNLLKRAAHVITNNAIRDGKLIKKPCEICSKKAEAHHDDYSSPLDVRWLCKKHHAEHHKRERENARIK